VTHRPESAGSHSRQEQCLPDVRLSQQVNIAPQSGAPRVQAESPPVCGNAVLWAAASCWFAGHRVYYRLRYRWLIRGLGVLLHRQAASWVESLYLYSARNPWSRQSMPIGGEGETMVGAHARPE